MDSEEAKQQMMKKNEQRILNDLRQRFARQLREYKLCLQRLSEAADVLLGDECGACGLMNTKLGECWQEWTSAKIQALDVFSWDVDSEIQSNWSTFLAEAMETEAGDQGDQDDVGPAVVVAQV